MNIKKLLGLEVRTLEELERERMFIISHLPLGRQIEAGEYWGKEYQRYMDRNNPFDYEHFLYKLAGYERANRRLRKYAKKLSKESR